MAPLLRCRVRWRQRTLARREVGRSVGVAGDAEIGQAPVSLIEQDVAGIEIPVPHPAVKAFERRGHVDQDVDPLGPVNSLIYGRQTILE
jgi:hypothetical protein